MTDASTTVLPAALANVDPAQVVLLLDCDGVLAPIVDDPAAAAVPEPVLALVRRAVDECALVAVVTGRNVERAREMVPVDGVWLAGMHGMHVVAPDGTEFLDEVAVAAREHVAVAAQLAQTVGWAYEDKDLTVTIHFRQRGALGQDVDAEHVKAQLMTVLNPLKVEVQHAKQVLEIRPKGSKTKADGVRIVADSVSGIESKVVVYVGDDLTDLDAFHGLDELHARGIRTVKIAVGGSEAPEALVAAANHVLERESDVPIFLAALLGN
ncbi:MAG: ycjT [Thermoleophilia bacterium]|nr:ycjT [Thermoleophilia bacterium]